MDSHRLFVKYAFVATIGSLLIGYGIREFLRATGGGYYCCNHAVYQTKGAIIALLGWGILLYALYGPYRAGFPENSR